MPTNTPPAPTADTPAPPPGALYGIARVGALACSAVLLIATLGSLAIGFGLFEDKGEVAGGRTGSGVFEALAASGSGDEEGAPVLPGSIVLDITALTVVVFGTLLGLGRFRNGVGIALLCCAGITAISAVLVWVTQGVNAPDVGVGRRVVQFGLYGRVMVGAAFAALAAAVVLGRSLASVRHCAIGVAMLAPVVGALVWLNLRGPASAGGDMGPAMEIVRIMLILFGSLVAFTLASVGGGMIIRAFDEADERLAPPAGT